MGKKLGRSTPATGIRILNTLKSSKNLYTELLKKANYFSEGWAVCKYHSHIQAIHYDYKLGDTKADFQFSYHF